MKKPTQSEFEQARLAAEARIAAKQDPENLAKAFVYLDAHAQELAKLADQLELYLRFGNDVEEHQRLVSNLAIYRERIRREEENESFGLE